MLLRHEGFRRLVLARDLIREDREPAPTIADLAREVGISPFHFIRQFEAVFGLTPHQYRIQERLERAKRLLAAGRHTVTDVCMEVGAFENRRRADRRMLGRDWRWQCESS